MKNVGGPDDDRTKEIEPPADQPARRSPLRGVLEVVATVVAALLIAAVGAGIVYTIDRGAPNTVVGAQHDRDAAQQEAATAEKRLTIADSERDQARNDGYQLGCNIAAQQVHDEAPQAFADDTSVSEAAANCTRDFPHGVIACKLPNPQTVPPGTLHTPQLGDLAELRVEVWLSRLPGNSLRPTHTLVC